MSNTAKDKLRRAISSRMPRRSVEAARLLEKGKLSPGTIWGAVDKLHKSKRWGAHPSFMLSGPKGTGKTTALVTVGCRELMQSRNVWYLPITRLPRVIKSHRDEKPQIADLESCDLLLLDELHRFSDLPAWVRTEGVALIDYRYGSKRQMCGAGTLPEDGLGSVLGLEIMERFDFLISSDEASYR